MSARSFLLMASLVSGVAFTGAAAQASEARSADTLPYVQTVGNALIGKAEFSAYRYGRRAYYRGGRRRAAVGAAVAAGVAGAVIGGAIAAQNRPAYGYGRPYGAYGYGPGYGYGY